MTTLTLLHPLPPAQPDFDAIDLTVVAQRGPFYRSTGSAFAHKPLFFGSGQGRWNDPDRDFGVLYMAMLPEGAYIETVQIPAGGLISESFLRERSMLSVVLRDPSVPLRLVDLTGPGLSRMGASAQLNAGDHDASRRWSQRIYHHPAKPDGILYTARHDPSQISVALYDRASALVEKQTPLAWMQWTECSTLLDWMERYDHAIDGAS